MKTCICCKKDLPKAEFGVYNHASDRLKAKCKVCTREYDGKRNRSGREILTAQNQEVKNRIVCSSTINKFASTYVPDRCYARNDGLKHVRSAGFPT